VRDDTTETAVWWGDVNRGMTPAHFAALKEDFFPVAQRISFMSPTCSAAARSEHRINVRVINEFAWHNLFIRTLLVRPSRELGAFVPEYTIIDLPSFRADPARHGMPQRDGDRGELHRKADPDRRHGLCGRDEEVGLRPAQLPAAVDGIMPMHCSANIGPDGDTAVFFGLSGTGKTTLSADASRTLIGDDEHGWSDTAVFNFEGGCYAKMIRISPEAEPEIFATTKRFGTVLENVVIDPVTRKWTSTTTRWPRTAVVRTPSISSPMPRRIIWGRCRRM
jgi:phosphoenolpyruvate carboxykinase (ATP)